MTGWDDRFDREDYLFGTGPAAFLKAQAKILPPASRVLCVADGEGRNSVYLASLGHIVTAFDLSSVGVAKARQLASETGEKVNFHVCSVDDWDWTKTFDGVVGIFVQFMPAPERDEMLKKMGAAVRPGGLMLLHGYAPRQVDYGTGGPPSKDHMYTRSQLALAFDGWEIVRLEEYDAHIEEGVGHAGLSALVDLIARKPL